MRRDTTALFLIFLAMFLIFRLSPVYTLFDSKYEMLFSERLVSQHSLSLDGQELQTLKAQNPALYQIVPSGDRFYYRFPIGGVVLSAPFVGIAHLFGISSLDKNGNYNLQREAGIQKTIASLVCAASVAVIFVTSRLFLSFGWSLLISLLSGLCTQIWSTASRAVWSHTWGVLILALAIWLIARTEAAKSRFHPVLFATCLSWLYFVRPAFLPSILAATIYVFFRRRADFGALLITGGAWLTAFMIYSCSVFHSLLPQIYSPTTFRSSESFWTGLTGTLVSPSRGLLIFLPWIGFLAYLLIRYRSFARTSLVLLAGAAIAIHILLIAAWFGWRGGHCYGPRLTTDIVPWIALLAILGTEARLKFAGQKPNNRTNEMIEWTVGAVLVLAAAVLNGLGAIWGDTIRWNMHPNNVDYHEERVWDWRHPQFLGIPPG